MAAETPTTSNKDGRSASAPKVPKNMVTQRKALSRSKGMQLFTTAHMEIKISRRYITVLRSGSEKGARRFVRAIIIVTAAPKGAAYFSAVERNRPRIRLVSDSKMVMKDGYASTQASINVICMGINGNAPLVNRQKKDTSTE